MNSRRNPATVLSSIGGLVFLVGFMRFLTAACAQEPPFGWAVSGGGNSLAIGYGVAVDRTGNRYIVGGFTSPQAAFGDIVLTNAGSVGIFIVKYDDTGTVAWARQAGGSGGDEARGIAIDPSGSIYVTGYFTSPNATFGSITLTNSDRPYEFDHSHLWQRRSQRCGRFGLPGTSRSGERAVRPCAAQEPKHVYGR